jgi:hypothetical protein
MNEQRTIVLVLRSGGDFSLRDVQLISRHINGKWKSSTRPRIICLWDKASDNYKIDDFEVMPLKNTFRGTWSRIQLYSPEMEQYRPFLYVDLDTAIINSLENIFNLIKNEFEFITLEDFWQKDRLATGLVWFPKDSSKVQMIYKHFKGEAGSRMDNYIRNIIHTPDRYFQQLTSTIHDFKPRKSGGITTIPEGTDVICFHGKPRIFNAISIPWVKDYVEATFKISKPLSGVTVIIPYNRDRGWLKDAINSVPDDVQLLLGKGDGNWPENFNKMLPEATGDFIRYLHEDDMLTPNCIEDSLKTFRDTGADFIHGSAIEMHMNSGLETIWKPPIMHPTLKDMLAKNYIHSATLMYRKEVFEKIGGFDESLNTAEEFEFSLRCLKAELKLGYCSKTLAYYRRHNEQKVRIVLPLHRKEERAMVVKKYIA